MAQPTQSDRQTLALRFELEGEDAATFADLSARSERTPTQQARFLLRQHIEQHRASRRQAQVAA